MKRNILTALAAGLCLAAPHASVASAQESQDQGLTTRGAFFATRPQGGAAAPQKSSAGGDASKGKQGGAANKKRTQSSSKSKPPSASVKTSGVGGNKAPGEAASASPAAVGVGYTLYMRDPNGDAVRVDPRREFSQGESVRVALEANTDGYLYIFHTEDGRAPQMLYPHARLNAGDNRIAAHRLYQIPPTADDWFTFDEKPAIERLYVVVSRTPLPNVPTGAALVEFCRGSDDCYWKPAADTWARVEREAGGRVLTGSDDVALGRAQTQSERDALTRGIKLSKADPAPSIVKMSAAPGSAVLVATLDLVHK